MAIKALIVDDDENVVFILTRICKKIENYAFEITVSPFYTLEGIVSLLKQSSFDLIFLDYQLEEESGLDILRGVRSHGFLMPIILMTALGDDHLVRNVFRSGGNDYLSKAELTPNLVGQAVLSCMRNYEQILELQTAKEKAEALNKTKNMLFTTINHQFKTPLNGVQSSAQSMSRMLEKQTLTPERTKAYIQIILHSSQEIGSMVDEVLEVAEIEKGIHLFFETVLLSSLVVELLEVKSFHLEKQNLRFSANIPEGLSVRADKKRLYQVLSHLVENAIKFTELGTIHIQAKSQNDYAIISIQDTGIGISKEKLPYIFEWFSQIDPSGFQVGLGLGLNICKKIIERMDGQIWVDSVVNQGSTFYLKIPMASQK